MNARIVLSFAFAMIAFGSLAQAEETGALPAAVDDHFYLLNSTTQGLVPPASEADVRTAKNSSVIAGLKSGSTGSGSSAVYSKTREARLAAAKAARAKAGIPPVWIGIMCAVAGMGLVIVGAVAWKRHLASSHDWMTDEHSGRISYQRWASSAVPTILASKLIEVQRSSVKKPAVIVEPVETRELRRAA